MKRDRKGFISIEYVIIGGLILVLMAWILSSAIPAKVQVAEEIVETDFERFDQRPDGLNDGIVQFRNSNE